MVICVPSSAVAWCSVVVTSVGIGRAAEAARMIGSHMARRAGTTAIDQGSRTAAANAPPVPFHLAEQLGEPTGT